MHEQFMREAIHLATEGVKAGEGGPFGAVVVRGREIVGRGCNRVVGGSDPTAHAEMEAIRDAARTLASFSLERCYLYVTCEPCPMCLAAAYWARLERIYFAAMAADAAAIGFDDVRIYQELATPLQQRKLPMRQMLREEALGPFRLWEQSPGKVLY